jgi:hypothetical protein
MKLCSVNPFNLKGRLLLQSGGLGGNPLPDTWPTLQQAQRIEE